MSYTIRVTYNTGDSFKTYVDTEDLDYGWDEETAKLNAEFIVEHYNAYYAINDGWRYEEKPDMELIKKKPWYADPDGKGTELDSTLYLMPGKEGKEPIRYVCPWCGYFESMISVEVVVEKFILHPKY